MQVLLPKVYFAYLKEKASIYKGGITFALPYRRMGLIWERGPRRRNLALVYGNWDRAGKSRFWSPGSISPSYALGMMQICPFL